ncbi:MAG: hypothetical protein AAF961_00985 [Planctomycetota bacterium]
MPSRIHAVVAATAIGVLAASNASRVGAKDHFLTIGGGYDPSGNQISLERNVAFLQQTLAERYRQPPPHDVFFADGDAPERDLVFLDSCGLDNCQPAQRMMCEVFGCADSAGLRYRNHEVADVRGPTEREAIRRRFRELGRQLNAGDRLFVYVTAHGGAGGDEYGDDYDYEYDEVEEQWVARESSGGEASLYEDFNTSLYLWDSESVEASEFGRWLDRIPPEVDVVLVMVQCYAGGFANAIYQRNDPELGLSPARRCGFFAQVHDRGAAGCTPEANEIEYEEYSSYFWAALRGSSRGGEPITSADYDGDRQVSLAEAHSYAVIESDTIDIPVRTSDVFLRRYSRLGGAVAEDDQSDEGGAVSRLFGNVFSAKKQPPQQELQEASGSLADLAAQARPDQRAVLEQLPSKLGMSGETTVEAVRVKLRHAKSEAAAANVRYQTARRAVRRAGAALYEDVCAEWPELTERFSLVAAELTSTRADEFTTVVESLPSYAAWSSAQQREEQRSDEVWAAQCLEAKTQRLLRTIENIVLSANLPRTASSEIVERYAQLIALEEASLDVPVDQLAEQP